MYDPVSKTYGDPSRRPECRSSTIEFIAPSEYMLRPPQVKLISTAYQTIIYFWLPLINSHFQAAVYIYLLDVSHQALDNGYLKVFCDILLDELDKLPGDGRTQVKICLIIICKEIA